MDITEAHLVWLFGGFLIVGFRLAYPALTTAIALLRADKRLGNLLRHVVTAFDRSWSAQNHRGNRWQRG